MPRFNKCSHMASLTEALAEPRRRSAISGHRAAKARGARFRWSVDAETRAAKRPRRTEAGFALIEVLVSAVIAGRSSPAASSPCCSATGRSAAEQRHRSEAYARRPGRPGAAALDADLRPQQPQRRPATVTLNGTPFTVNSTGDFVNDTTGDRLLRQRAPPRPTTSRSPPTSPGPAWATAAPVAIQSIVSPPNGSLDPSHGTLTISVDNAAGGTDPRHRPLGHRRRHLQRLRPTPPAAPMFADQPAGNYTLDPLGRRRRAGRQGRQHARPETVGVVAGATITLPLLLRPGRDRSPSRIQGQGRPARLVAVQRRLGRRLQHRHDHGEVFGTPGGTRLAKIEGHLALPLHLPRHRLRRRLQRQQPEPERRSQPAGRRGDRQRPRPPRRQRRRRRRSSCRRST